MGTLMGFDFTKVEHGNGLPVVHGHEEGEVLHVLEGAHCVFFPGGGGGEGGASH